MSTMYLDKPRARRIVKEELDRGEDLVRAEVVLAGDEFWNTEVIWEDGKVKKQRTFKCYESSFWATPTLVIYYKDGKERRLPVYTLKDNLTEQGEVW